MWPIAGTERGRQPFWSPDGKVLAFEKDGALYRIDVAGGAPNRLCDVPSQTFLGGSWGTRGVIVFGVDGDAIRWARFYVEPVDESETTVDDFIRDQAVRQ